MVYRAASWKLPSSAPNPERNMVDGAQFPSKPLRDAVHSAAESANPAPCADRQRADAAPLAENWAKPGALSPDVPDF